VCRPWPSFHAELWMSDTKKHLVMQNEETCCHRHNEISKQVSKYRLYFTVANCILGNKHNYTYAYKYVISKMQQKNPKLVAVSSSYGQPVQFIQYVIRNMTEFRNPSDWLIDSEKKRGPQLRWHTNTPYLTLVANDPSVYEWAHQSIILTLVFMNEHIRVSNWS